MTAVVDLLEQRLREALLNAFPKGESLNRLIRGRLDENPEVVAAGENLEARVDRLVLWARKHLKIEDLIRAACEDNPSNPLLVAWARDWKAAQVDPSNAATAATDLDRATIAIVVRVPKGPMVPVQMIPETLVHAFASVADSGYLARRVLRTAARLRQAAEPPDVRATVVHPEDLPVFESVGAHAFWWEVFTEARKHGPRMLAALVLAERDDLFSAEARHDRRVLLEQLAMFSSPQTGK